MRKKSEPIRIDSDLAFLLRKEAIKNHRTLTGQLRAMYEEQKQEHRQPDDLAGDLV